MSTESLHVFGRRCIALTAFLVAACASPFPELLVSNSPACALQSPWLPEYHLDSTCDRSWHNSREHRVKRYQEIMLQLSQQQQQQQQVVIDALHTIPTPTALYAPNQVLIEETISCPNGALQDLWRVAGERHVLSLGLPTKWIVENTASSAVVVALVTSSSQTISPLLVSAAHFIVSPPQRDVDAVLQPGEWKSYDVLEGQVFHVYQLEQQHKEPAQLGKLVLQHRVGLISIQKSPSEQHEKDERWNQLCRSTDQHDRPSAPTVSSFPQASPSSFIDRSLHYPFAMNHEHERCNILYRGFLNNVGCDVDVYYVRSKGAGEPCHEVKKFRLGTNVSNSNNMANSNIQYQATLADSTFVVRLTHHPEVVVNTITIQPTRIVNCFDSHHPPASSTTSTDHDTSNERKLPDATIHNQTMAILEYRWLSLLSLPPRNVTQEQQLPTEYFVSS